ncbi:MAG TPA: class I SAM-dependent methyltransferase, partial [Dehalococcoidia bacterium]
MTMQSDGDHYDRLARFYDLSMAGFDADIDLYEAFSRRTDAPVLELGSGTGRVAFALADRGIDVSGIERSAAMQEIASHRAAGSGLPIPKLQLGDMRCPTVEGSFGLIICAVDTFLHLQNTGEQLATLTAARERLAPNGRL